MACLSCVIRQRLQWLNDTEITRYLSILLAEVWLFNLKQQVIFVDLVCLSGRDVFVEPKAIRSILPYLPRSGV